MTMQIAGLDNVKGILKRSQFTLPTSDGNSGQVITTDGSGQLGWKDLSFKNTISVASSGGQYSTITSAINYINTQTHDASNRWVIQVYPGIYEENIVIPSYVSLVGLGGQEGSVEIKSLSSKLDTVTLPVDGECLVDGITATNFIDTPPNSNVMDYYTVKVGGVGYVVGDVLTVTDSTNTTYFKVVSVDGSGSVLHAALLKGINLSTGQYATTGGTGTGCIIYKIYDRPPAAIAILEGGIVDAVIQNCKFNGLISAAALSGTVTSMYVGSGNILLFNNIFYALKEGTYATYNSRILANLVLGTGTTAKRHIEARNNTFLILNNDETIRCVNIYTYSSGDYIEFRFANCNFSIINKDISRTGTAYIYKNSNVYRVYVKDRLFQSCKMRIVNTGGVASATLEESGLHYVAGQTYVAANGDFNCQIQVNTVNAGAIQTFTVLSAGTNYVPEVFTLYQPNTGTTMGESARFMPSLDKTPGGSNIAFECYSQSFSTLDLVDCNIEVLGGSINKIESVSGYIRSAGCTFKADDLSTDLYGSFFDGENTRFKNGSVYVDRDIRFNAQDGEHWTALSASSTQAANLTIQLPKTLPSQNQGLVATSVAGDNVQLGWASSGSVSTSTSAIANNQIAESNVSGFIINANIATSGQAKYTVYRKTDSGEVAESGTIYYVYKTVAATWEIATQHTGNANISFSMTSTGQLKYTTNNMAGTNYTGTMSFILDNLAVSVPTNVTIVNNQTSSQIITGLLLNGFLYRGAKIKFAIYRNTSTTELAEYGELNAVYKTVANTWEMSSNGVGITTGVDLTIANTGQISYTSSNLSGTSYTGIMRWVIEYITI